MVSRYLNPNRKLSNQQSGFTLVELLVVIGILGILMAITIIAINPVQQFQNSRNSQRQADVTSILDAVYQYETVPHGATLAGNLPPSLASLPTGAVLLAGISFPVSVSTTSFSSPNLTLTVASGNIITGNIGSVTVSGCNQAGDNGTFSLVSGTTTTVVVNDIGGSATPATGCSITAWTGAANVCSDLIPTHIAALPMDPSGSAGTQCATPYNSGYKVSYATSGNRFTVTAPAAENGASISATR